MINTQWLELPMSRTNFQGPKDVRAIEVRLYSKEDTQEVPQSKNIAYCWHQKNQSTDSTGGSIIFECRSWKGLSTVSFNS